MPVSYSVEPGNKAENQEANINNTQPIIIGAPRQEIIPQPPQPVVEITQTDRLNKRLLVSFLNRLNAQSTDQNKTDQQQTADDKNNESDCSFDSD